MPYLLLIGAFTLNALANIFLKLGALRGIAFSGLSFGQILSQNLFAIVGLACFALNAFFYFLALRHVPLTIGYPIMVVMSLLIINSYAMFALKEEVSLVQLVGYALIIAGIALVFFFKR